MLRTAILVFITATVCVPAPVHAHAEELARIRAADEPARLLLVRGRTASSRFRRLVHAIARGNAIVHVVWDRSCRASMTGTTRLVAYSGGYRFVRVTLAGQADADSAVALLGHELQHVAELVAAPWVVDDDGMRKLYGAIGHPSCPAGTCFDTRAARDAGVRILDELRHAQVASESAY